MTRTRARSSRRTGARALGAPRRGRSRATWERSERDRPAMPSPIRNLWSRLLGDRGERAAARYLRRQGLRVLVRGYRTRCGEIDLIARDGDTLVFVEVKARQRGVPAEAVTAEKQRRITLAALHFLR